MKRLLFLIALGCSVTLCLSSSTKVVRLAEVSCEEAANEIYDYFADSHGEEYAYNKALNYWVQCEILNPE